MTALTMPTEAPGLTRRRTLLAGVGLGVTAGVAAALTPRRHEATLGTLKVAEVVPRAVAPWTSKPSSSLVVPETEEPTSVYDQVLTRSYLAAGLNDVMLLIAYGAAQSGLMKVHRPEVCYASSGFSVGPLSSADISFAGRTIAAETFTARRQDRVEQVMYWTRVSNAFPRNLTAERLLVLERGAQGIIPDGVLVRASVLQEGPAAIALLRRFTAALVAAASPEGLGLLIGRE